MKTIYVGLTGLSRAGKTVFLTAAIHDFVESNGRDLKEFAFSAWRFVGNPEQLPNGVEPFPYKAHVKAFREEPPRWPSPTVDITEYRLRLQLINDNNHRKREGMVVFVDYPGERLLDVALLDLSYEEWSDDTWERLGNSGGRAGDAARDFLECVRTMQPEVSENRSQVAACAFGEFCMLSRKEGRPIAPVDPVLRAEQESSEISTPFFPLNLETRQRLPKLQKALQKKFVRYRKKVVAPFLQRIAACSHQIVLVDLFDVLRAGPGKYNEVQEQMQRVLNCYRKINSGLFKYLLSIVPLIGRPQINKVTFCATKADQATRDYRDNLCSLLRDMHAKAEQALKFDQIKDTKFHAIAAHRCTEDIDTDHEGKPIVALRGVLIEKGNETEGLYFPGRVPDLWPLEKAEWKGFAFPGFLPRKLPDISNGRPLPNIKMDEILFAIVEDLVQ